MATAEDILEKSRTKRKGAFKAIQRRSWDYINESPNNDDIQEQSDKNKPQLIKDKIQEPESLKINIENILDKGTEEAGVDAESNLKNDNNEAHKENIDTPTNEILQKKLLTLAGHQKQIMRLVTSHIKSRGGAPYTVGIFPNILALKIKADIEVTRVSLKRLVEKNLLVRLKGEKGRNGCCKFKAREDVVKACFTLFNDSPCDINVIDNKTSEFPLLGEEKED